MSILFCLEFSHFPHFRDIFLHFSTVESPLKHIPDKNHLRFIFGIGPNRCPTRTKTKNLPEIPYLTFLRQKKLNNQNQFVSLNIFVYIKPNEYFRKNFLEIFHIVGFQLQPERRGKTWEGVGSPTYPFSFLLLSNLRNLQFYVGKYFSRNFKNKSPYLQRFSKS